MAKKTLRLTDQIRFKVIFKGLTIQNLKMLKFSLNLQKLEFKTFSQEHHTKKGLAQPCKVRKM